MSESGEGNWGKCERRVWASRTTTMPRVSMFSISLYRFPPLPLWRVAIDISLLLYLAQSRREAIGFGVPAILPQQKCRIWVGTWYSRMSFLSELGCRTEEEGREHILDRRRSQIPMRRRGLLLLLLIRRRCESDVSPSAG